MHEGTLDDLTEERPWRMSMKRHRCDEADGQQPWRLRWDPAPGAPARGAQDAAVTIVEFCNYESLFCKRSHRAVLDLLDAFPDSVRVVFRHVALPFHEETELAQRACGQGPEALEGAARLLFGAGLDPNRASAEALALLPGIGPARAAAIVAERARGPFRRPGDLARVHGIGPRTVAKLRPWLQIGPDVADP